MSKLIGKVTITMGNLEYIIDVDPRDIGKFVDDTLVAFDEVLRNVISVDKFGKNFSLLSNTQKVSVDESIESLK